MSPPPWPAPRAPSVGVLRPSAALAAYVDHYWFSLTPAEAVTVVLPDGRIDLVLAQGSRQAAVTVHGSVTARTAVPLLPGARYIGVQFRPGVARHFLDVAADELTDCIAPGLDVARWSLAPALDADDPRRAIAAIDAALRRHLSRTQPPTARIDHLVSAMERAQGMLRVDALADRYGISRRQIERDFRHAVGLTPKTFAAILRFRHAGRCIREGQSLAEVALAAGYADQSHLTRAFSRLAGLPPRAYARGDVAFLQDSKAPAGDDDSLFINEELSS